MNIYDILYKIVEARPWTDPERAEALIVIRGLEHINALGTATGQLDLKDHECERGGLYFPKSMQCQVCGKGMDPPPHGCQPHDAQPGGTGWYRSASQVRCLICNKEMS